MAGLTAEPRLGSVAIVTMYFAARGTWDQRRTSGWVGWTMIAPYAGDWSAGADVHAFTRERGAVQDEGDPSLAIARTRHQYVPFGIVFLSVARVFRVVN